MARLREEGLTLAEIGRRLGVTRQCVEYSLKVMARGRERPPSFTCAGCAEEVPSAAAAPSDSGSALCLPCLAKRPGAAFAERLKAYRLAAGLTRPELARRAGLYGGARPSTSWGRWSPARRSWPGWFACWGRG